MISWLVQASENGFDGNLVPLIGTSLTDVIPNVLFNYTLANTVPSWVNITVNSFKSNL